MKQMRSRFRLLTLLLVCAFLLTLVLCTGSILKISGFTLPALSSVSLIKESGTPEPSVSQDVLPSAGTESLTPENTPAENSLPGTDNTADPQYNVFGL